DVDLVGDLRAAEDRDEGTLGIAVRVAQEFEFLLDEEPDGARLTLEGLGGAEGAGVLAVRGAEGVVHVHVAQLGKLLGEIRIILLLFLMETEILQQKDLAILEVIGRLLDAWADR